MVLLEEDKAKLFTTCALICSCKFRSEGTSFSDRSSAERVRSLIHAESAYYQVVMFS